ncbi:MAG: hypothetical protein DMF52_15295 [Acidobacteria bacterium]|nr:MAG: hypothetical protein DMF52_15295 [Acidobacteriota bacterium]
MRGALRRPVCPGATGPDWRLAVIPRARYRRPIQGLYLCGSGTHPGTGLTGGSGANAAREILQGPKLRTPSGPGQPLPIRRSSASSSTQCAPLSSLPSSAYIPRQQPLTGTQ